MKDDSYVSGAVLDINVLEGLAPRGSPQSTEALDVEDETFASKDEDAQALQSRLPHYPYRQWMRLLLMTWLKNLRSRWGLPLFSLCSPLLNTSYPPWWSLSIPQQMLLTWHDSLTTLFDVMDSFNMDLLAVYDQILRSSLLSKELIDC